MSLKTQKIVTDLPLILSPVSFVVDSPKIRENVVTFFLSLRFFFFCEKQLHQKSSISPIPSACFGGIASAEGPVALFGGENCFPVPVFFRAPP